MISPKNPDKSKMKEELKQKIRDTLKKQSYGLIGDHCAVKICNWNKNSLIGRGECYKFKFYGIQSWRCCQMSPWIDCDNKCIHCWRPMELDMSELINKNKLMNPREIIESCIKGQRKLLTGFGGHDKVDRKRFKEAQEPRHFAISLIGEPTIYPKIGELVAEVRKGGRTSFIVTNGLHPDILKKLEKKNQLPTQLYLSLNSSNEKEYNKWHNSIHKDAWKKYNQTLDFMKKLTEKGKRTVLRMTMIRGMNMSDKHIAEFAEIIKKSGAMFVEVKSFMSLGPSREKLPYEVMPHIEEIEAFSKKLAKASGYIVLDKHVPSRIVLLGKNLEAKRRMKISKSEI